MAYRKFANTQPTALSSSATNSDTTLYVSDGSTFPDPAVGGNGPYTILVGFGTSREEVCTVTAKPGTNILTVTRGEDGSSATAKNIGDVVVHGVSKRDWDDLVPKTAQVIAGSGLTGGGDLSADRTLNVGAGNGISVAADSVGLDSALSFGRRNRIINGDFSVNQRAFTSTSAPAGGYGFDRWAAYGSGGTTTYSTQAPALGDLPESARAFARMVTTGHAAAGDYALFYQPIESVRTLSGKTVTVSFWAKAAAGTPKVAVELKQSFGTGGSPSADVFTYVGQVTLSTTWTRYSVSVAVPSIAGKTLGTGGNDCLTLNFWTSAGSTYNSRTGTLGIQNTTIDIWGVQLEEGSFATAFEVEEYGENLRRCQRFYWRYVSPSTDFIFFLDGGIYNGVARFLARFPVPMRKSPTFSSSAYTAFNVITNTFTTTAPTGIVGGDYGSIHSVEVRCTGMTGVTNGAATGLHTPSAGTYLAFDAEL